MKFAFILLLIVFSNVCSSEPIYYRMDTSKRCFVKKFKDRKFYEANPRTFSHVRIFAKPHKRNERYSVFRYENELYVTLTSCLNPGNLDNEDDELFDSEAIEENSRMRRVVSDSLRFSENKFFLELDAGTVNISGKKPIFPYHKLSGIDQDGDDLQFTDPTPSNYKAGPSFILGGGYRLNDYQFLAVRLKYFQGSKTENVPTSVNSAPPVNVSFKYEDKFTSAQVGTKFIFFESYRFKPVLAGYVGMNQISSSQKIGSTDSLKYQSTGLTASIEAGFEFLLNSNLGVGLTGGYEYLSNKKFSLKDKKDSTSGEEGFSSGISYSNTFVNLGLRVYFK